MLFEYIRVLTTNKGLTRMPYISPLFNKCVIRMKAVFCQTYVRLKPRVTCVFALALESIWHWDKIKFCVCMYVTNLWCFCPPDTLLEKFLIAIDKEAIIDLARRICAFDWSMKYVFVTALESIWLGMTCSLWYSFTSLIRVWKKASL